jgi:hypothetical protein
MLGKPFLFIESVIIEPLMIDIADRFFVRIFAGLLPPELDHIGQGHVLGTPV